MHQFVSRNVLDDRQKQQHRAKGVVLHQFGYIRIVRRYDQPKWVSWSISAWSTLVRSSGTALAQQILDLLDLPSDAPMPFELPRQICRCGHGHVPQTNGGAGLPIDIPSIPGGVSLPGHSAVYPPGDGIAEGDPTAILVEVEGYARSLAAALLSRIPRAVHSCWNGPWCDSTPV
jgi:hypothetical protein